MSKFPIEIIACICVFMADANCQQSQMQKNSIPPIKIESFNLLVSNINADLKIKRNLILDTVFQDNERNIYAYAAKVNDGYVNLFYVKNINQNKIKKIIQSESDFSKVSSIINVPNALVFSSSKKVEWWIKSKNEKEFYIIELLINPNGLNKKITNYSIWVGVITE